MPTSLGHGRLLSCDSVTTRYCPSIYLFPGQGNCLLKSRMNMLHPRSHSLIVLVKIEDLNYGIDWPDGWHVTMSVMQLGVPAQSCLSVLTPHSSSSCLPIAFTSNFYILNNSRCGPSGEKLSIPYASVRTSTNIQ